MYRTIKRLKIDKKAFKLKSIAGIRNYRLCSPPRSPGPCDCKPQVPSYQTIKPPPSTCRKGEIPPNPCVPRYHHGKGTWKKYKYISLFIGFPLILIQAMRVTGNKTPPKESCREYEYMRRRTKRFPWRDGNTSLFHNEHVNNLPEDCEPPPLDCE